MFKSVKIFFSKKFLLKNLVKMMSKKQLTCMLALHIMYLLVGASIFYHIESPLEVKQRAEDKLERLEIQSKCNLIQLVSNTFVYANNFIITLFCDETLNCLYLCQNSLR